MTTDHNPMDAINTTDGNAERLATLKSLYPDLFTNEGKLNITELQKLADPNSVNETERFEFKWFSKSQAKRNAFAPTNATLVFDAARSVNPQSSQHMIIEGENLEVLKLLKEGYREKIKCIYIDPPYNTGKDFVYSDNFTQDKRAYWQDNGTVDAGLKMDANSESDGRYHSHWLNMMFSRLLLARELLRDDGAIFISIGDDEVHHMRKLCDEVFGEENFINLVCVNMKNIAGASGGGEDKKLKKNIEYVYIYCKNYEFLSTFNNIYTLTPITKLVQEYRDEDVSWKYTSVLVFDGIKEYVGSAKDGDGNEIKIYVRKNPVIKSINQVIREDGLSEEQVYFKYAKKIFQTAMPQSSIRPRVIQRVNELGLINDFYSIEYVPKSGKNKGEVYEQFYKGESFRLLAWLGDVSEIIDGVLYKKDLQGAYWDFASETKNLTKEGDVPLPNGKKPLALLNRLLNLNTQKDDIVLDFFGGSGTTGHAVMELNKADGGNRQFILVQIPEQTDEASEAYKAGYKKISDITIARNQKVAAKLALEGVETGFKVFKLAMSNFPRVLFELDPKLDEAGNLARLQQYINEKERQLFNTFDEANLLTEIIIKRGFNLNYVANKAEQFVQNNVLWVTDGNKKAFVCLDDKLADETVVYFSKNINEHFICLERALDTTKKWNLKHAMGHLFFAF